MHKTIRIKWYGIMPRVALSKSQKIQNNVFLRVSCNSPSFKSSSYAARVTLCELFIPIKSRRLDTFSSSKWSFIVPIKCANVWYRVSRNNTKIRGSRSCPCCLLERRRENGSAAAILLRSGTPVRRVNKH